MVYAIAVFAPLVGALISGLLGKVIGDRAAMGASVLGMVVAAVCGAYAFFTLVPDGELSDPLFALGVGAELIVRKRTKGLFLRDAPLAAEPHLFVATVTGVAAGVFW